MLSAVGCDWSPTQHSTSRVLHSLQSVCVFFLGRSLFVFVCHGRFGLPLRKFLRLQLLVQKLHIPNYADFHCSMPLLNKASTVHGYHSRYSKQFEKYRIKLLPGLEKQLMPRWKASSAYGSFTNCLILSWLQSKTGLSGKKSENCRSLLGRPLEGLYTFWWAVISAFLCTRARAHTIL